MIEVDQGRVLLLLVELNCPAWPCQNVASNRNAWPAAGRGSTEITSSGERPDLSKLKQHRHILYI